MRITNIRITLENLNIAKDSKGNFVYKISRISKQEQYGKTGFALKCLVLGDSVNIKFYDGTEQEMKELADELAVKGTINVLIPDAVFHIYNRPQNGDHDCGVYGTATKFEILSDEIDF